MGSPEGLSFNITNRDCMTALINPLEVKLRELGVTVLSGHRALSLKVEGERIAGVAVQGAGGSGEILHVSPADVQDSGWTSLVSREGVPVLVKREGGGISLLTPAVPIWVARLCRMRAAVFSVHAMPEGSAAMEMFLAGRRRQLW